MPISYETRLFYNNDELLDSLSYSNLRESYQYDDDGNLSTWDVYSEDEGLIGHFTYSNFDDKNNPYMLLAKSIGQSFFHSADGMSDDYYVFKHNPGTIVKTGENEFTASYTYEYNSNNYPTKSIRVDDQGTTTVTTYEYIGCN